jgi:hypothetical protein
MVSSQATGIAAEFGSRKEGRCSRESFLSILMDLLATVSVAIPVPSRRLFPFHRLDPHLPPYPLPSS